MDCRISVDEAPALRRTENGLVRLQEPQLLSNNPMSAIPDSLSVELTLTLSLIVHTSSVPFPCSHSILLVVTYTSEPNAA